MLIRATPTFRPGSQATVEPLPQVPKTAPQVDSPMARPWALMTA